MRVANIHYSEIILKGRNRSKFEQALIYNIIKSLKGERYKNIKKQESRIILELDESSDEQAIIQKLRVVFGIAWFSIADQLPRDIAAVGKIVCEKLKEKKGSFRIVTTRADKNFQKTSMEVSKELGTIVCEKTGLNVDLENPDNIVYVQILSNSAIVSMEKILGFGGLPIGISGTVLSLLSGGIDSPVSSWLMMKRGCNVEYLHIHPHPDNQDVEGTKITEIVRILKSYGGSGKLYLVPYHEFYKRTVELPDKKEMVLFRRFIIRLAERLARQNKMLGLVTGDNIGQVASQTLENMAAVDSAVDMSVYRPLATYNKDEIISLAKTIGTYDASIGQYKDCCSLVSAKHPETRANVDEILELEKKIEIELVIERTMGHVSVIRI